MIEKAINRILGLSVPNQITDPTGRIFIDKKMTELKPELPSRPDRMGINTLSGIVDYVRNGIDDEREYVIHIADYDKVLLMGGYNPEFCVRKHYIYAESDLERFPFGSWLDHESFIIKMLSFFKHDGDENDFQELMAYLKQIAVEKGITLKDDGVTQQTNIKTGVVFTATKEVPNPVKLIAYETFPEVEEIKRSFVFRVRENSRSGIECALFESGDTRWKLEYIQAIKEYFKKNLIPDSSHTEEMKISIIA